MKAQKKKLIFLSAFAIVLAVAMSFFVVLDPIFKKFMFKKCDVVTTKGSTIVHFVSVGQGDAMVVKFPDQKIMLIDNGPTTAGVTYVKYLQDYVVNTCMTKKIDYLVLSHADADHVGNTVTLLENFDVKKIFLPTYPSTTETYLEIGNRLPDFDVQIVENYQANIIGGKGYSVDFFNLPTQMVKSTNDSCPLIKLSVNGTSFLFAGDIDEANEEYYVDNYGSFLDCDVLKVAHHGNSTATKEKFLNCVTPQYAVICVGENIYGHPDEETLDRLGNLQIKTYRTDSDGSILMFSDKQIPLGVKTGNVLVTGLSLNYCVVCGLILAFVLLKILMILLPQKRIEE